LLQKGDEIYLTAAVTGATKTVDIDSGDAATLFGASLIMPTQVAGVPWY
jgi:hypothetical protein